MEVILKPVSVASNRTLESTGREVRLGMAPATFPRHVSRFVRVMMSFMGWRWFVRGNRVIEVKSPVSFGPGTAFCGEMISRLNHNT